MEMYCTMTCAEFIRTLDYNDVRDTEYSFRQSQNYTLYDSPFSVQLHLVVEFRCDEICQRAHHVELLALIIVGVLVVWVTWAHLATKKRVSYLLRRLPLMWDLSKL